MTAEEVVRVSPDARLSEVVEALIGANIGAVVVGDKAKVIGIISERDVMHALGAGGDLDAMSAMDVAREPRLVRCHRHGCRGCGRDDAAVCPPRSWSGTANSGHRLARDLLGVYAAEDVEIE